MCMYTRVMLLTTDGNIALYINYHGDIMQQPNKSRLISLEVTIDGKVHVSVTAKFYGRGGGAGILIYGAITPPPQKKKEED